MQSIQIDLRIQIDSVKTNWVTETQIAANPEACDKQGNKIEGFSLRENKIPRSVVTHNNISLDTAEFNTLWREFCKGYEFYPKYWGIEGDSVLRIFYDSYSKKDSEFFFELVESFMSETFKCEFDLNRRAG